MAQIDLEKLNSEVEEFKKKYDRTDLEPPKVLKKYMSDAEKILKKYPDPEGEAREILGRLCKLVGYDLVMNCEDLEPGVFYYHKAIELCPDSIDMRWGYYTTLEEIIEDEDYATPELIQDAIDCLKFIIDRCDTPELKQQHRVHIRYVSLGRVYLIANQPEKALECAKKSLEIQESESARDLMEEAESRL